MSVNLKHIRIFLALGDCMPMVGRSVRKGFSIKCWLMLGVLLAGRSFAESASVEGGMSPVALDFKGESIETSDAGHVTLEWEVSGNPESDLSFELQRGLSDQFSSPEIVYQGTDTASFRSGLPRGIYYYRVRSRGSGDSGPISGWSAVKRVEVTPQSLPVALGLFCTGAVVFSAITLFILRRSHSSQFSPGVA
jgi:hypothetical protein